VRVEQTVSEMVVEVLARQAEALSGETGRPLEETSAEVLRTSAGRLLGELAEGSHRHEQAADWQDGLLRDREAQRPARLRSSENGREADEVGRHSWLAHYMEWLGARTGAKSTTRCCAKGSPPCKVDLDARKVFNT
jgi:hypothetical protein